MSEATSPPAPQPSPLAGALRTPAAKVVLLLGLLLLMQVPLAMVSGLIAERQARQAEVLASFQREWGPAQEVFGPVLAIPYAWSEPAPKPADPPVRRRGWIQVPPSQFAVTARLQPQRRRRGLFRAIVYDARVELAGTITVPDIQPSAPGAELLWREAVVVLSASSLRGMPAGARMEWNGEQAPLALASLAGECGGIASVPARLDAAPAPGTAMPFRASLALRGTQSFRVVPAARQVEMQVSSPWRTPSFTGPALPVSDAVGTDGFTAAWQMAGTVPPTGWVAHGSPQAGCRGAVWQGSDEQVGVELLEAVPVHLMVSRAAKYGVLFLALSFLTYFLFETVSGSRIHVVQYGLLGLSVSLFALLLVAVAEPLGFAPAYAISTAAVLAQASLYTLSVTRRPRLAAVFAGVLALLFGFLYVVLSLEAYSLLVGTVALFAGLSVVMAVTRRVDWSAVRPGGAAPDPRA